MKVLYIKTKLINFINILKKLIMKHKIIEIEDALVPLKPAIDIEQERASFPDITDESFWEIFEICAPHTLLPTENLYGLYGSVKYLCDRKIPGDFVECGVFKGGAIMMVAETLLRHGITDKKIYLFDTFYGFTGRTEFDITYLGQEEGLFTTQNFRRGTEDNLRKIDYPFDNYIIVEGDVEKTIPDIIPDKIALLRLDTDTYTTTLCELTHLYPKLVQGGVLIVDDYGWCKGARKAVDEYFSKTEKLFFHRTNYTCRTALKY
jgi:hypothetical protein